jgi:hypothetical protein
VSCRTKPIIPKMPRSKRRATDPVPRRTRPSFAPPNGVLADSNDYWSAGKAYYDPTKITVPAHRDLPPYMAQTVFPLLVSSPGKRYVAQLSAMTQSDPELQRLLPKSASSPFHQP